MPQDNLTLKAKEPQTSDGMEMEPEGGVQTCSNENDAPGYMTETIRKVFTTGRILT